MEKLAAVLTKENAFEEYIDMMHKSWSYARLTEEEKGRLNEVMGRLKLCGTLKQRWENLHAVNYAFLLGCGYKPVGWREEEKTTF